ncbi:hypothetical protein IQ254_10535 [Nodosilinea sp. LEGE 07088]|uniref:hypothetical protein n=1 Tax=Nodosilinea sp. LEGE 07088 TaxID=2777968 RepID=UPI00187E6C57|nr:hypothetical protein [Nodosilinea sp. LEGE 07088]MBE9137646.1 hypothetical protein [Nodosilinea sp. LEGE 07088]
MKASIGAGIQQGGKGQIRESHKFLKHKTKGKQLRKPYTFLGSENKFSDRIRPLLLGWFLAFFFLGCALNLTSVGGGNRLNIPEARNSVGLQNDL